METIGSRVKNERTARGIDRAELSRLTGIGYSTLAELERGGMKTSTKLRVIADALGVSIEWLETGRGPKALVPGASQPAGLDFEKIGAAVKVLTHYLELVGDPPEWVSDPVLLEIAYQVADEFGQPVRPDNVLDLTKILAKRMRGQQGDGEQRTIRGTGTAAGR